MSNHTYAIVGAGALGSFYGAKLQKAGLDVHFLLKSDYEHVRKNGLIIESIDGDFTLPQVNAYDHVDKMPQCDVVVIALKTTQNHLLSNILPSIVKDDGIVLVFQNGLGLEAEVAQIVNGTIIGGVCFLTANKIAPGHISNLRYQNIILGEYIQDYHPSRMTDRMLQISHDFESAGVPIELSQDLLLARWKKLVWNIPYNGLSVILDATTTELMADNYSRQLVEQLMREVIAGAKSCDRIIPDNFIDTMLNHTAQLKPYRTSMKIDYDERRPMEVEAIFGNPLRMAQAAGVKLPQISCLYHQLKFLDAKRQKETTQTVSWRSN